MEPRESELRGLGAIESNIDKLVSNRMRKRGMAWAVRGAANMLALVTLRVNGLLGMSLEAILGPPAQASRPRTQSRRRTSQGIRSVHMPGLDSGRPLARLLRPYARVYPLV